MRYQESQTTINPNGKNYRYVEIDFIDGRWVADLKLYHPEDLDDIICTLRANNPRFSDWYELGDEFTPQAIPDIRSQIENEPNEVYAAIDTNTDKVIFYWGVNEYWD